MVGTKQWILIEGRLGREGKGGKGSLVGLSGTAGGQSGARVFVGEIGWWGAAGLEDFGDFCGVDGGCWQILAAYSREQHGMYDTAFCRMGAFLQQRDVDRLLG